MGALHGIPRHPTIGYTVKHECLLDVFMAELFELRLKPRINFRL
jgi:hypothetical protein